MKNLSVYEITFDAYFIYIFMYPYIYNIHRIFKRVEIRGRVRSIQKVD